MKVLAAAADVDQLNLLNPTHWPVLFGALSDEVSLCHDTWISLSSQNEWFKPGYRGRHPSFFGHRCPWEVLRMAWWNSPMSCPHLCQAKVRGAAIENLGDLAGDLDLQDMGAWRIAT